MLEYIIFSTELNSCKMKTSILRGKENDVKVIFVDDMPVGAKIR